MFLVAALSFPDPAPAFGVGPVVDEWDRFLAVYDPESAFDALDSLDGAVSPACLAVSGLD